MGNYSVYGNSKYLIYLNDFVRTIENIQGDPMTSSKAEQFFADKHEAIEDLQKQYKNYRDELAKNHIVPLQELVLELDKPLGVKQWVWNKFDLVHDFDCNGSKICLEAQVTPGGWMLILWARHKRKCEAAMKPILEELGDETARFKRNEHDRRIVQTFELADPHEEVAKALRYYHSLIERKLNALANTAATAEKPAS